MRSVGITNPGTATLWMPAGSVRISNGADAGHDPQHFQRQRRHEFALRHHDHRHAPHDAVALGADGEQARARRRPFQGPARCAADPGNSKRKGCGSPPSIAMPTGRRLRSVGCGRASGKPDSPSTTRELRMASANTWSLLGSARSLLRVSSSRLRERVGRDRRRQAVRLGEHDVEGDGGGAELGQTRDQIGDERARPRPLAELAGFSRRYRRSPPAAASPSRGLRT